MSVGTHCPTDHQGDPLVTHASGRFGLSVALSTPFTASGAIDLHRLTAHARWCVSQGCDSVTVFGTTGEGAAIAAGDRHAVLGALVGAGFEPARQVIAGVAAVSQDDALEQARIGYAHGCRALLLAPPFYFKGVDDEGLFAWFARHIESLGPQARDIILYHIPSMTAVGCARPSPASSPASRIRPATTPTPRRCWTGTAISPSSSATSVSSPGRFGPVPRAPSAGSPILPPTSSGTWPWTDATIRASTPSSTRCARCR